VRKGITRNHLYKADSATGCMVHSLNPDRGKGFSLLQNVQTGCGVHTASCSMGTGFFFCGGKATSMVWTGKTTLIVCYKADRHRQIENMRHIL
jgi:hypothetical protein